MEHKEKTQGLLLYFSATGFKAWQSLSAILGYEFNWVKFLKLLNNYDAHFTRFDVAIDVIDRNFTVKGLYQQLQEKKMFILDSHKRTIPAQRQKFFGENAMVTGLTCGSRSSNNYLRIYNKKIEQNRKNAPYHSLARQCKSWTRIEAEFKHDSAHAILPDLVNKTSLTIEQKLIGYVVKQWLFVNRQKKLIPLWRLLTKLANGEGSIPPLQPELTDRFVQELKWFFTGGGTGVIYKVGQLFGEFGMQNFWLFMHKYMEEPNTADHFSVPKNLRQDVTFIRRQHPNLKTVNYYLKRAVKEIEEEKKANHPDQSND